MSIRSLIYLGFLLAFSSCKEEQESIVVKKQDLVEAVYSSVLVEPAEYYSVKSAVTGYLDQVFVAEGAVVQKGSILFSVKDLNAKNAANNADLAYRLAQSNYTSDQSVLSDIRLEIDNLKLKLQNDSINLNRSRSLFEKGALSKAELEQEELRFASSRSNYEGARNRYNRTVSELRTMKEQARNNYELSLSRVSDAQIAAIMDGRVYSLLKDKGDLVSVQEPIALIGKSDKFSVKLMIDEGDIAKVEKGQMVLIRLEAYPGKQFEGKVIQIAPRMDERTQTFEVTADFVQTPQKLYMGLTGEASIVVNERKNAIVIPTAYLNEKGEVETADGMRKVKTGVRSLSKVEILDGLEEGEIIYKPEL